MRIHALLQHPRGQGHIRQLPLHARDQMHAARLRFDMHAVPQRGGQSRRRGVAPFAVQPPHALDVPAEMPFGNERGQDGLRQPRRGARQQPADAVESPHLRGRHDQVR
ncbi:hypothetical protein G6F58_013621 [Rhizopus delemar]|nr:hypothetical protein G6F58_013621 [Rhizopus delemar]